MGHLLCRVTNAAVVAGAPWGHQQNVPLAPLGQQRRRWLPDKVGGPTGFSGARPCASLARRLVSGPEPSDTISLSGGTPNKWSCGPPGTPKIFGLNMARRRALADKLSWSRHGVLSGCGDLLSACLTQGGIKSPVKLLRFLVNFSKRSCNSVGSPWGVSRTRSLHCAQVSCAILQL